MFKLLQKIFIWFIGIILLCCVIVIGVPVTIGTVIYYLFKPEKSREAAKEVEVEKTESNNTGIH